MKRACLTIFCLALCVAAAIPYLRSQTNGSEQNTLLSQATAPAKSGGFIHEWLVLGTFPNSDPQTMLSREYIPDERGITPSSGEACSGREWRAEQITDAGNLNFNQMGFDLNENCSVYAHIYLHSDTERNVMVLIGSDDGIMMRVNGKVVHENLVWRGWGPDTDKVTARIGKGWNRFLFKVFNGVGGFDLSVRITDAGGAPIPGLEYSPENPYRGETYVDPDVEPWVIVDNVRPGAELMRVEGRFVLPVRLFARNIGTRDAKDVRVMLVGIGGEKGKEEKTLFRRRISANITGGDPIELFLSEKEILALINSEGTLEVEVTWSGRTERRSCQFTANDLLDALFAMKPEKMPGQAGIPKGVVDKLAYLDANFRWARYFSSEPFIVKRGYAQELFRAVFSKDWKSAGSKLDLLIERIKTDSDLIKKSTIRFAGNAHIDMAWLWKYDETIQVCYETFASALDFADRCRDFVYVQSQAQAYWWMENRFPALFRRIQEKVKSGQWEIVGGMWVEPDLNIPSGESIVRQILYGKRYFRDKFGVDVKVGYNPDTFGYSLMLPAIFKNSGIDYFITQKLGWNDTNKFPHRLFWWESPEGSRVLTFFPHTYVHDASIDRVAEQFKEFEQMSGTNDQLVLYGVGNHGGGPTEKNIKNIEAMKKLDAFPKVRESSVLSFMNTVESNPAASNYPVWKDELYLETHRGVLTTQAANKKNNRMSEILLEEAEKYAILSGIDYPSDELHEAWRLTLFNQFHDILPGSSIGDVYEDSSVQYAFVRSLAERVIGRSLVRAASSIGFKSEGIPIVVFNPLSWNRTEYARFQPPESFNEKMGIFDEKGREIPFEIENDEIVFPADDVPSIGYTTFYLRESSNLLAEIDIDTLDLRGVYRGFQASESKIDEDFLENEYLKVTVDPKTGNIASIFDKENGREVLEQGKGGNVLELFEDIPSEFDAWNIGYTGKAWKIEKVKRIDVKRRDPFKVSLRIERAFGDSTFIQDLTLYAGVPRLDIENTIDWKEDHKLLKAAFNCAVRNDFATYEIPYGTIKRAAIPKNSFDKAKYEVSGHKWIDLSDRSGSYGVSLLNDCKYGFDVKDNVIRITLLKAPKYPDPKADRGVHRFMYSIYPHRGDWRQGQSFRRAYELNYPLRTVVVDSGRMASSGKSAGPKNAQLEDSSRTDTDRPEMMSLVSSPQTDIMITVVKKAEDSDDIIVRFYELHGRQLDAELVFNGDIVQVREVDLMERPLRDLKFNGNRVVVQTGAHEIKTLIVRLKRSS